MYAVGNSVPRFSPLDEVYEVLLVVLIGTEE
jgi:hypothetical protein